MSVIELKTPAGVTVNSVKDVKPDLWIEAMAQHLKQQGKFVVPKYMEHAKTACYKELSPESPDFVYTRAAAILRQFIVNPQREFGVGRLAAKFGGKKRNGVGREHRALASRGIIRHCVKELEKLGYIKQKSADVQRRVITSSGQSTATQIAKSL
eukprot:GHVH01003543.1.p2 GENE.GHVH01003543.1~~GHVH01003543.1.p2  ORF type:complete len:154 (+),score=26.69 GHVH01003543.1:44-505(+)